MFYNGRIIKTIRKMGAIFVEYAFLYVYFDIVVIRVLIGRMITGKLDQFCLKNIH